MCSLIYQVFLGSLLCAWLHWALGMSGEGDTEVPALGAFRFPEWPRVPWVGLQAPALLFTSHRPPGTLHPRVSCPPLTWEYPCRLRGCDWRSNEKTSIKLSAQAQHIPIFHEYSCLLLVMIIFRTAAWVKTFLKKEIQRLLLPSLLRLLLPVSIYSFIPSFSPGTPGLC